MFDGQATGAVSLDRAALILHEELADTETELALLSSRPVRLESVLKHMQNFQKHVKTTVRRGYCAMLF